MSRKKKIIYLIVFLVGVISIGYYINSLGNTVLVGAYDDDVAYSEEKVDGKPEIKKEDLGDVTLLVGEQYPLKKGTYKWESRQSDGGTCGAYYISDTNKEHSETNRVKVSGEIKVKDNNSYIDMTDTTGNESGRCTSQKLIGVNYEASEETTEKVWASYGKAYSGKEVCALADEEIPCKDFDYYDELKGKMKQSDLDSLHPMSKTQVGVESGSDFVEFRENKPFGKTICYRGVSNSYATDKQTNSLPLTFDIGTGGNYIGEEVDCSKLTLSEEDMYDIGIKF